MLKLSRAVELATTSSMVRTCATGNPPLAARSCSVIVAASWCGSPCVRTTQRNRTQACVELGHAVGHLCMRE